MFTSWWFTPALIISILQTSTRKLRMVFGVRMLYRTSKGTSVILKTDHPFTMSGHSTSCQHLHSFSESNFNDHTNWYRRLQMVDMVDTTRPVDFFGTRCAACLASKGVPILIYNSTNPVYWPAARAGYFCIGVRSFPTWPRFPVPAANGTSRTR